MPALLLLCLALSAACPAQPGGFSIHGVVRSQSGEKIASAHVLLHLAGPDSTVVGFAFTNDKGAYRIAVPDALLTCRLCVRMLGYQAPCVQADREAGRNFAPQDFVLAPRPVVLQETIVRPKPWMRRTGDTTVYDARGMTDAADRTVEDVLRKLPGIRVADNGDITVQGKPVEKVMVEGQDLYGRSYKLITRSLPADALEKVEAVDNFTDNALLRDIEKSGRTVLNLTIRPERKARPFGSLTGGMGTAGRYQAAAALFSITPHASGGIVADANTLGTDVTETVNPEPPGTMDAARLSQHPANPVLLPAILPDVPAERYISNRGRLLAPAATLAQHKKLKVKTFGYVYADRQRQDHTVKEAYATASEPVLVQESGSRIHAPAGARGQVEAAYALGGAASVQFSTSASLFSGGRRHAGWIENPGLSETVADNLRHDRLLTEQRLVFTHRLKGRNALLVQMEHTYLRASTQQQVESLRFARFFTLPEAFGCLRQAVAETEGTRAAAVHWKGASADNTFQVGIRAASARETTVSGSYLEDAATGETRQTDGAFTNEAAYARSTVALEAQSRIAGRNRATYTIGMALPVIHIRFDDGPAKVHFRERRFIATPSLTFGWQLGQSHRATLRYADHLQLPRKEDLLAGYVLAGYRTFSKGAAALALARVRALSLAYTYTHLPTFVTFVQLIGFRQTGSPYVASAAATDALSWQEALPYPGTFQHLFSSSQLDIFFPALSSTVRWEGGYSENRNSMVVNAVAQRNAFRELSTAIQMTTAWQKRFNFRAGGRLEGVVFSPRRGLVKQEAARAGVFKPFASVRVVAGQHWLATATLEQCTWRTRANTTTARFADVGLRYQAGAGKWQVEGMFKNLLGADKLVFNQFEGALVSYAQYLLQPRYLLVRVERKF